MNRSRLGRADIFQTGSQPVPEGTSCEAVQILPQSFSGFSVVKRLNGVTDLVTLAAGGNVPISPRGDTLTIAGSNHSLLRRSGASLLGLLLLVPILFLQAQDYAIDWYTIDGGGGTSSGGLYTVSGTVGQSDAGRMTGGNFTLVGGFWSVVTAGQSPRAPWLSIIQTNGLITVSWPMSASGFLLQERPTLDVVATPWTVVPPSLYQTNATDIFLQITAPMGNRFYRLQKP